MTRCHGCHVEKDRQTLEAYPYPEDGLAADPVPPLFDIEVEPDGGGPWRETTVCHECFHKLDVDMWISRRCWEAIDPKTPYGDLPAVKHPPA